MAEKPETRSQAAQKAAPEAENEAVPRPPQGPSSNPPILNPSEVVDPMQQTLHMMMALITNQQKQQDQLSLQLAAQQEASLEQQRQLFQTLAEQQKALTTLAKPPIVDSGNTDAPSNVDPTPRSNQGAAKKMDTPLLKCPPEETTLAVFRTWRKSYEGYAELTHLAIDCSLRGRQQILRSALHDHWVQLWDNGLLGIDEAVDDTTELLDHISKYLRQNRNPLLDRQAFYSRTQQSGESVDSYLAALRMLVESCEYSEFSACMHCGNPCGDGLKMKNDRLRDRLVCGVRDRISQQKLLEEPFSELSLDRALTICRAMEASKETQEHLNIAAGDSTSEVNQMKPQIKGNRPPPKGRTTRNKRYQSYNSKVPASSDDCDNCGGKKHDAANPCPAKDVSCFNCNEIGHYRRHCPSTQQTKATKQANCIRISHTPLVVGSIQSQGKEKVLLQTAHHSRKTNAFAWLPDPGAFCDAMSGEALASLGGTGTFEVKEDTDRLVGADGQRMTSYGIVWLTIQRGDRRYDAPVHLVKGCNDPLLSKAGCIALGLLPPEWPHIPLKMNALSLSGSQATTSLQNDVTQPPSPFQDEPHSHGKNQILADFVDVFPENDDAPLKAMTGPEMKIELLPTAKPVKRYKAYNVPLHWEDKVKGKLTELESKGIIESVPLGETPEWQHPMVVVPKKDSDEPRITVDFTSLNPYVKRPGYPTKVPREEVAKIPPGMKFFTTLDARHGYWQVPLAEESRPLTTFITPWGSKRFCRNAMGLSSAGDEHNRRGDEAIAGIPNVLKIVEDYLIFDTDLETHEMRVRTVLERCREAGITLGRKKFSYAKPTAKWCGYLIDEEGYSVNPDLVKALQAFPVPKNKHDLRSFCGLVQQFESFTAELANLLQPLRSLLGSNAAFVWEGHQQHAFESTIKELVNPRKLAQFQPNAPLRLETDAAQSCGLGFALWQQQSDATWRLLQCGSRFLSPTESRYSATEVELLAVTWAVKKCKLYLLGSHFELLVDHRPLESILNHKTLDMIETPRIIRLKEKLGCYRLHATWRPGSKHVVVDSFSRHPVDPPTTEDLEGENEVEGFAKLTLRSISLAPVDLQLERICEAGTKDNVYSTLQNAIKEGTRSSHWKNPLLHPYKPFQGSLSLIDGMIMHQHHRLLIPASLRKETLKYLHSTHQGRDRTIRRARESIFWPGITNDISNLIKSCEECASHQSSQSREPLLADVLPSRPGEAIATDLFSFAGKTYLIITDKYSGWREVYDCGRGGGADTDKVAHFLLQWSRMMGLPNRLTSDGGPPFQSKGFQEYMKEWNTKHDPSSPYNPQSNGHAEAAVKAMKNLMAKVSPKGSLDSPAFMEAMIEYHNTPRADGLSPAIRLFGRPLRSRLPAHPIVFSRPIQKRLEEADHLAECLKAKAKQHYDMHSRSLPQLAVGDVVRVQHPQTKKWDMIAEVVKPYPRQRSFLIKTETGRLYWRNRRFLKHFHGGKEEADESSVPEKEEISQSPEVVRRSARSCRPPSRFRQ